MKLHFMLFLLVVCSVSNMLSELSHQNEPMTTLKFVRKLFNSISKAALTVVPLVFMIDN